MVFYSLEPCMEKAGRKAELPCFLPSTRGEGTSQPIRSLLPLPLGAPREKWVGGSLDAPSWRQHVTGEVRLSPSKAGSCSLSPAESRKRLGASLSVPPSLPLPTDLYSLWDGGAPANTCGSEAPGGPAKCSLPWWEKPLDGFLQF